MTRAVKDILSAAKKLSKYDYIIAIDVHTVHMTVEGFSKNFSSYIISPRPSKEYPTEFSHYEEGIKFFAISEASCTTNGVCYE